MKGSRIAILSLIAVLVAAIAIPALTVIPTAEEEMISVSYYEGDRLVATVDQAVGDAPSSGGYYFWDNDRGLSLSTPTKYFSDPEMTAEVTAITPDTATLYAVADEAGEAPKYAVFSGVPSLATLIKVSADGIELRDDLFSADTRVIQTYTDTAVTFTATGTALTHDITLDLMGNTLTMSGSSNPVSPAAGITYRLSNGTLNTSVDLAFTQAKSTAVNIVFDNITVNSSASTLIDIRFNANITANNSSFNLAADGTRLLRMSAERTVNMTFTDCDFNVPAEYSVANGLFYSPQYTSGTNGSKCNTTLNFYGCLFDVQNSSANIFTRERNGASNPILKVNVAESANRPSAFLTEATIYSDAHYSSDAPSTVPYGVTVADGTLFSVASPNYYNVTPTLPQGAKIVLANDDSVAKYVLTADYVTATEVANGKSTAVNYQKGYTRSSTYGYVIDKLNGAVGVKEVIAVAYYDADGNLIPVYAPQGGETVTVRTDIETGRWADWVILNSAEDSIVASSLDPEFAGVTALSTELLANIPDGGIMRLFADFSATSPIALPAGATLDLGGKTLTAQITYTDTSFEGAVTVKNGTLSSTSAQILYTPSPFKGRIRLEDLKLVNTGNSANSYLADFRGGSLVLDRCNITTGTQAFRLGATYSAGSSISIAATDTDITADGSSARYAFVILPTKNNLAPQISVSLTDCDISCDALLATAKHNNGYVISANTAVDITVADSSLKVGSIFSLATDCKTSLDLSDTRLSADPRTDADTLTYGKGQMLVNSGDAEFPFAVTVPVRMSWNLTLSNDIRVNLLISSERVVSINVNDTDYDLKSLPKDEYGDYRISLPPVAANRAMNAISIRIGYTDGANTYCVNSTKTVADYALELFATDNSDKSKQLIAATMNYIYSAYLYARSQDQDAPAAPEALTDLLASDTYKSYGVNRSLLSDGELDEGNLDLAITNAQLDLASDLRFRFNLNPSYSGTLTINGKTYRIQEGKDTATDLAYLTVSGRAYSLYRDALSITGASNDGTAISGEYSLAAYVNGVKDKADEDTLRLLGALSTYVTLASEYKTEVDNAKADFVPEAEIVNKGGADAAVTYVIDDGMDERNPDTASIALEFLNKYEHLRLSFAMVTQQLATLETTTDPETGKQVYVMDGDRYVYTVIQAAYDFWTNIMNTGRAELISHTHTHNFWGNNDDGGSFTYVNSNNNPIKSQEFPVGSSSKEIYASMQILADLFPVAKYPLSLVNCFINAGISVPMEDTVANDGKTYESYYKYFKELLMQAMEEGTILGIRNTFTTSTTDGSRNKVVLPEHMATLEGRSNTNAFMVTSKNNGENCQNWTAYIDHAIEQGGWACFCIHKIVTEESTGHWIYKDNADVLFGYTKDKNVWIATYSEAVIYYSQWSTSEVITELRDGDIFISVTDRERDDIYNMALTVKVTVPEDWQSATFMGEELSILTNADGSRYVLVDVVPDSGEHCINGSN